MAYIASKTYPNIILVQEPPKLTEDILNIIEESGFEIIHKAKYNVARAIILIKFGFQAKPFKQIMHKDLAAVKINGNNPVYIFSVYIHEKSDIMENTKHMMDTKEWKSRRVIYAGDFNTMSVM